MIRIESERDLLDAVQHVRQIAEQPENILLPGEDLQSRTPKAGWIPRELLRPDSELAEQLTVDDQVKVLDLLEYLRIHFHAPGADTAVRITYELRQEFVLLHKVRMRVLTIQIDVQGSVTQQVVMENQAAMFAMAMPYCAMFFPLHDNVEPSINVHKPIARKSKTGTEYRTPLMMRFRADHDDPKNRVLLPQDIKGPGGLFDANGTPL
tara:strand:- start:2076 stop:2699 length:624 start_codon:yes stop_codon:yes gene_type:complete